MFSTEAASIDANGYEIPAKIRVRNQSVAKGLVTPLSRPATSPMSAMSSALHVTKNTSRKRLWTIASAGSALMAKAETRATTKTRVISPRLGCSDVSRT